jgi:DNA end-binding protein Ku
MQSSRESKREQIDNATADSRGESSATLDSERACFISVESPVFMIEELPVAPRAYWKGYLKLSLVSCPIALFPATSEREKISFHQLNKNTGNRI